MNMLKNRIRNKRIPARKQQRGVVLISVLIFLLLLVYFVRMSMSAAIVNEEKAGVDLDLTIAREMTYMALQDAVHDLRSEDYAATYCGNKDQTCLSPTARIVTANAMTDKKQSPEEQQSYSTEFFAKTATISGTDGLYNSEAQKGCKNNLEILPLWQCVNWGRYFGEVSNNFVNSKNLPSVEYGQFTGAPFPYKATEVPRPRYIIEVFPGTTVGLAKGYLARVTAVGFGRISGKDNAGVTNVIQQAVYVLE